MPAIALGIGAIFKLVLNTILVPINPDFFILGGTAGAAVSTTVCHLVACMIDLWVVKKNINLDLKVSRYVTKPLLAVGMMSVAAIFSYQYLSSVVTSKIVTLLSILIAGIVYILSVILLKIFSKDYIYMIPYGKNLYKVLKKLRIYEK